MRRRYVLFATMLALLAGPVRPAYAVFHLWEIKEVYSNADGSVQFIELFTEVGSQDEVLGHEVTVTWTGGSNTFTFPSNTGNPTGNKHLLLATAGFAALCGGVAPDYTLPADFFDPGATGTLTINFVGADSISFDLATLPTNGRDSLTDTNLGGAANLISGASSPTNFAGAQGALNLIGCLADGDCDGCDDGLGCNGVEDTCQASTGTCPGTPPCAQQCIEPGTCVECTEAAHCSDGNPCTDDVCSGSNTCENPANTAPCDDGLFCTGDDVCAGSACIHAGTPCGALNCNEGPDTCGDCQGDPDCDDGAFCNGAETCSGGTCAAGAGDPCTPPAVCDEDGDQCVTPVADAGVPDAAPAGPDAAVPDAGVGPDAGGGGGGGGCCRSGPGGAGDALPGLLLALAALRRRRRPASKAPMM